MKGNGAWQTRDQLEQAAKAAQTALIETGEISQSPVQKGSAQPAKLGRGSRITRTNVQLPSGLMAGTVDTDDKCSKSKNGYGKHSPDPDSVAARDGELVVDVNCKHCGQSGSVTIKPEDILW
jgi:hypothetical protein